MSQGPGAVPEAGGAGGEGVTAMQALEGAHERAPPASVESLDMTVQPHEPMPKVATNEICFQTYDVLIQEYPPYARIDKWIVPSSAILSQVMLPIGRAFTRASATRR
jgi:hypothetical protein